MTEPKIHKSVMVDAAVAALHIKNQERYIDATLGTGGHAMEILSQGGKVLGIDMDPEMLKIAEDRLSENFNKENFKLVNGNFANIRRIANENGWQSPDGILFDLGVSNLHLKNEERGFSFANPEAKLDMRLNPEMQGVKGSDMLNALRADQLEEMFMAVMEGGPARWLTKRVVARRELMPFETVGDFLEICEGVKNRANSLSEATLPFLALRMVVNSELDNLQSVLPEAFGLLKDGGRLVVITFHSGEETIVKRFIKNLVGGWASEVESAGNEEVKENPRARSAKMRVITKNETN
jgi:16S rRNA (cytosine1402-N4)-methyltransferase